MKITSVLNVIMKNRFEDIPIFLDIIFKNEGITQNSLKKKSNWCLGKTQECCKAIKLIGLAINGNGLTITSKGKQFLFEYNKNNNTLNQEMKKNMCLSIPLFKEVYEENPNLKNFKNLHLIFKNKLMNKYEISSKKIAYYDRVYIRSAVWRYLEGFHNEFPEDNLNKRLRVSANRLREGQKPISSFCEEKKNVGINEDTFLKAMNLRDEILNQPLYISIKKHNSKIIKAVINSKIKEGNNSPPEK